MPRYCNCGNGRGLKSLCGVPRLTTVEELAVAKKGGLVWRGCGSLFNPTANRATVRHLRIPEHRKGRRGTIFWHVCAFSGLECCRRAFHRQSPTWKWGFAHKRGSSWSSCYVWNRISLLPIIRKFGIVSVLATNEVWKLFWKTCALFEMAFVRDRSPRELLKRFWCWKRFSRGFCQLISGGEVQNGVFFLSTSCYETSKLFWNVYELFEMAFCWGSSSLRLVGGFEVGRGFPEVFVGSWVKEERVNDLFFVRFDSLVLMSKKNLPILLRSKNFFRSGVNSSIKWTPPPAS